MKMNFAKKATALAMSVLFAVSMAGCGSSASTAKKVEVTSVEDLADVDRSNGTLTMATNAEFEPWEYKEGNDIVGIDADISKAICDKLGYELKIEDMSFETILASVNSGKADFGAAGMTVTPEREESVDFTDTYADATQVVIVRK